jgi:imidazole glycerol phosphate synthase subunit HisF
MWGENMSVVKVSCTDQVLKFVQAPVIASGGMNEVKLEFDFCEK